MEQRKQNFMATLVSVFLFLVLYWGLEWNILVSALLAIGTFFGVYFLSKPRVKLGNLDVEMLQNGLELKELTDEADRDLKELNDYLRSIKSPEISKNGSALFELGTNIVTYLKRNPEKISKARRFLNYYLDTARDIVAKYAKFEGANIQSQELDELHGKTSKALVILQEAFKKQYVKLVANDMMDIEADINLLENTLREEGF